MSSSRVPKLISIHLFLTNPIKEFDLKHTVFDKLPGITLVQLQWNEKHMGHTSLSDIHVYKYMC